MALPFSTFPSEYEAVFKDVTDEFLEIYCGKPKQCEINECENEQFKCDEVMGIEYYQDKFPNLPVEVYPILVKESKIKLDKMKLEQQKLDEELLNK